MGCFGVFGFAALLLAVWWLQDLGFMRVRGRGTKISFWMFVWVERQSMVIMMVCGSRSSRDFL